MLDTTGPPNQVIDYVQLSGPNSVRDLTSEIITNYDTPANTSRVQRKRACGTRIFKTDLAHRVDQPDWCVHGQLYSQSHASGAWDPDESHLAANEIDGFRVFFGYSPPVLYTPANAQAIAEGSNDQFHTGALHAHGDGRPAFLLAGERSAGSLHRPAI